MSTARKKALLKLPGERKNPQKRGPKGVEVLNVSGGPPITKLLDTEIAALVGKSGAAEIDLDHPQFQLPSDIFLQNAPDAIKELNLSNNLLTEFTHAQHLSKLKRVFLSNNAITEISFKGLKNVVQFVVNNNRIEHLPDMSDLQKLVYLDLSGNRPTTGFAELAKLKSLRVLDLGDCGISLSTSEFSTFLLVHLKKLPKLEYLNFSGNPIQDTIPHFRYLVIHELPHLKYLNWDMISKEDRRLAQELAEKGTWNDKSKPLGTVEKPPESASDDPLAQLDDILNMALADQPKTDGAAAAGSGSVDADYLDMLNSMLDSDLLPSGSSTTTTNMDDTSALESLMKEMDLDFDSLINPSKSSKPAESTSDLDYLDMLNGMIAGESAPSQPSATPSKAPSQAEDKDYLDMLEDILDGTVPGATKPADKPSATSQSKPAPLDTTDAELDELLASVGLSDFVTTKPAATTTATPATTATTTTTAPAPTAPTTTTPPAKPDDDYLALLDELTAEAVASVEKPTSTAPPTSSTNTTTIDDFDIEALEAELLGIKNETKSQETSAPASTPSASEPQKLVQTAVVVTPEVIKPVVAQAPLPQAPAAQPKAPAAQPKASAPAPAKKMPIAAQPPATKEPPAPSGEAKGSVASLAKKFAFKPSDVQQRQPSASVSAVQGKTPAGFGKIPATQSDQPATGVPKRGIEARSQSTSMVAGLAAKLAGVVTNPPKQMRPPAERAAEESAPASPPTRSPSKSGIKLPAAFGVTLKSRPSETDVSSGAAKGDGKRPLPAPTKGPVNAAGAKKGPLPAQPAATQAQAQPQAESPIQAPTPVQPAAQPPASTTESSSKVNSLLDELETLVAETISESMELDEIRNSRSPTPSPSSEPATPAAPATTTPPVVNEPVAPAVTVPVTEPEPKVAEAAQPKAEPTVTQRAATPPAPAPEPEPEPKAPTEPVKPQTQPMPAQQAQPEEPAPVKQPSPTAPKRPSPAALLQTDDDDFDAVLERMMSKRNAPATTPAPSTQAPTPAPASTPTAEPAPEPEPAIAAPVTPAPIESILEEPPSVARSLQRGGRKASVRLPPRYPWDADISAISIHSQLGKGSFGTTFEGYWRPDPMNPENAKHVALKRLASSDLSAEAVQSFQSEAQALIKLEHKNLVQLLGAGVSDAKHLIWEYVDGVSIKQFLAKAQGPPSHQWALYVAREIVDALDYLHSQGVIHGVLNSNNVIIDKQMSAKVKDYGFLDIKDNVPADDTLPGYMAPELLTGEQYNEKIDVYSFSILFLEMLTRKAPFEGQSAGYITEQVRMRQRRPDIPTTVPPVLERLIRACWTTDPERRPTFAKVKAILAMPEEKLLAGGYAQQQQQEQEPEQFFPAAASPAIPPSTPVQTSYIERPQPEQLVVSERPMVTAAPLPPAPAKQAKQEPAPAPKKEKVKVAKPKPLALRQDTGLDNEQERKLAVVLAKVTEMLNSGVPANQLKAIAVLLDIVKDEHRVQYVAKKSTVVRDLVELITDTDPNLRPSAFGATGPFEAVEGVLKALAQLAQTHSSMITALANARAVPSLVDLISRDNEALCMLACKVLTELAVDANMREIIHKAGGLYPLVNLLRSQNEFVQVQASWTLSELLDDEAIQNDFILAGGLRLLVDKVDTTNAGLKIRVMEALANFYHNEKARDALRGINLKEKFMAMLSAPNQLLKATAIKGIAKFTRNETFFQNEVEVVKVLNALITGLGNPSTTRRERSLMVQTIANMTKTQEYLIHFRDLGGLSMIVRTLIGERDDDIKLTILQVLFSALSDEKSRDAILALGAVTPIILQLQSADIQLRQMALKALLLLSEYPKGLSAIFASGVTSRLVTVVAFSTEKADVIYALKLMLQLARSEEYRGELRDAGAIGCLVERLRDIDTAVIPRLASMVIANLCADELSRDVLIQENGLVKWVSYVKEAAKNTKVGDNDAAEMIGLCLMAVTNFVEDESNWANLRDAGAPEMVCFSLSHPEASVLTKALRCLLTLLKDPKNKRVVQSMAIERLKDLELHSHPNIPRAAAAVLQKLQEQLNN